MYWEQAQSELQLLFQETRIGLITDVDGTISPFAEHPDRAVVTRRNWELLRELQSHLTLVAFISGRTAEDIQARVGLPGAIYVGNHGLERWMDGRVERLPEVVAFRPQIEKALEAIRLRQLPGMLLEDKGATLSIHYRQTASPNQVETRLLPIMQNIASEFGLRLFQGRMVFELRPPIEADKGTAFRGLVEEYALKAALYLGDDTTDVAALKMARQLRELGHCYALGVGVVSDGTPKTVLDNSDIWATGVTGVESFLERLLSAAKASST